MPTGGSISLELGYLCIPVCKINFLPRITAALDTEKNKAEQPSKPSPRNCPVNATAHIVPCRPSCPIHSWWGCNVIRCHQFTQYFSPFLLKLNVIKSFRSSQEFWSLLWAPQMNNAIRLLFMQSGQLSIEVVILPELGKNMRPGKKTKK